MVVLSTTNYMNITDCYLDYPINSIVFVNSYSGGVNFSIYDLATLA
jgi:hypothetical protein